MGVIAKILILFGASRMLFLFFAVIGTIFIPLREGYLGRQNFPEVPYLAWIWANFDGRHYLDVATEGYRGTNFAFFPFYPLLISTAGQILSILPLYIGIIISLLSFYIALFFIYKIVSLDYDRKIALLTVSILSFFPLSFFYQAVYVDSLFLCLSVLSFYWARRSNWILAGLFGGLATLTRLAGIALVPSLIIEWYLQNRKNIEGLTINTVIKFAKNGLIASLLAGSGVLIYMLYLQFNFGDFLLFQKSMIAWRQNEFVFPPQVIFRYLKIFWLVEKNLLVFWVALVEFISLFLYMGLAIYTWKKIRVSYGLFMMVLLLLVAFTGTLAGIQRYVLHLFPAFLALALILDKRGVLKLFVFAIFIMLGFIFTGLFTRGYWIA